MGKKNDEIGEEKLEQWLGENIPEALRHRENKERRLINAVKNNNKKYDVALRRLLQKTIRETKKSERLEKKYTRSQARKATLKRPSSIVSIDSTIADLDKEIKKTKETLARLEKLRKRLTFNKKRVLTNIKKEGTKLIDDYKSNNETVIKGKRTRKYIFNYVNTDLTKEMMGYLEKDIKNSFALKFSNTYLLKENETGKTMRYSNNNERSEWFGDVNKARSFVTHHERERLNPDNINRPNTQWGFVRHLQVQMKVIVKDNVPLLPSDEPVGNACLPQWLKNNRYIYSIDNFEDNYCFWRCLAIYNILKQNKDNMTPAIQHKLRRGCTQDAKILASNFYSGLENQDGSVTLNALDNIDMYFKIGVNIYTSEEQKWTLIRRATKYKDILTIGMYENHFFFIKDIEKAIKLSQ